MQQLPFELRHQIVIDGHLPVLESCPMVRCLAFAVDQHGGDQRTFEDLLAICSEALGDYREHSGGMDPATRDDWTVFAHMACQRADFARDGYFDHDGLLSIIDQSALMIAAWNGDRPPGVALQPSESAFLRQDHSDRVDVLHERAFYEAQQELHATSPAAGDEDTSALEDKTVPIGKIDRAEAVKLRERQAAAHARLEKNPFDEGAMLELEALQTDYAKVYGDDKAGSSMVITDQTEGETDG